MAPKNSDASTKRVMNKGAWTAEEDKILAQCIEVHGAKRWKTIALKSGLNRCGKSCRLRWLNYLRPNIKRGNISDEEEDLILRLHKLLGNRWSLIARRLPGRTDNEIKNYWNSHLSKKISQNQKEKIPDSSSLPQTTMAQKTWEVEEELSTRGVAAGDLKVSFDVDEFFDFSFDVDEFFDFSIEGFCG